jgi:hypothetical protein
LLWEEQLGDKVMIEILFGDSEAASMKAAKRKENPEEVICLNLMLDIGNLEESVDSPYRKELIYSMWKQSFTYKTSKISRRYIR